METAVFGIKVGGVLLSSQQTCLAADSRTVTFRLIVFRPFVSEVIVGTVTSCTEKFIHGQETER